jgi:energy-coupling factor transporter ATP-binding protein EcfA2
MKKDNQITKLPSRYEPLVETFGEKSKSTFVPVQNDLNVIKKLIARSESASQGKIMFISGESGIGKSTFIHSLEVFLSDKVSKVERIPPPHELEVEKVPEYISNVIRQEKITIINFDGREAPFFHEEQYRNFIIQLNNVLRSRKDIIVLQPVTDEKFAQKICKLFEGIGGNSAFGAEQIHKLNGLPKDQFEITLGKILQIANWKLEDAAIETDEISKIQNGSSRIGEFLDKVGNLIADRFDTDSLGITFPKIVIAISSDNPEVRAICRNLRRADSFYIESARLLMVTKKSNVAEWWSQRSKDIKASLPHIIALFDAQLVSVSASSVVHSVVCYGSNELSSLIQPFRKNKGNAKKIIKSSELYKFVTGTELDVIQTTGGVSDETTNAYKKIQEKSKTHHKAINKAIVEMVIDAGGDINNPLYENSIIEGSQTDVVFEYDARSISLELHHIISKECVENKIAIYILEKLKEYTINIGLAMR